MERMTLVLAQMLNENPPTTPGGESGAPESGSDENPGTEDTTLPALPFVNPARNSNPNSSNNRSGIPSVIEDDFANLRSSFVNRYLVFKKENCRIWL